jgi:hypothetical protein
MRKIILTRLAQFSIHKIVRRSIYKIFLSLLPNKYFITTSVRVKDFSIAEDRGETEFFLAKI